MFKIRKGIFETNSSSVHTLCINKRNDLKIPNSFKFDRGEEFGWSYDTYNDDMSKGDYLYQLIENYAFYMGKDEFESSDIYLTKYDGNVKLYCPEDYPEYDAMIKKYEKELKDKIESILSNYGCVNIIWEPSHENDKKIFGNGYIDHACEAHQFLRDMLDNPELLINFLFNNNSCIYTGNDNYEDESTYVDCDEYDYVFEKGN